MFAVGMGAAILPAGVIMPVRNILTWEDFIRTEQGYDISHGLWLTRHELLIAGSDGQLRQFWTQASGKSQLEVANACQQARHQLIEHAQLHGRLADCYLLPR